MTKHRGIALLLVLWVLALLSTLLAALAGGVRLEYRQALWQQQRTQALMAAEAGLCLAVLALNAQPVQARWAADGSVHAAEFAGMALRVRIRSERGKLDLNAAPVGSIARLLQAEGAPPAVAAQVAAAVERQRGRSPLRTLEELRPLPGMSGVLYNRVVPYITVWSGQAQPDAGLVARPLARALGLPNVRTAALDAGQIFTITSQARSPGGQATTLRATVLMTTAKEGARPYRVLRWQS